MTATGPRDVSKARANARAHCPLLVQVLCRADTEPLRAGVIISLRPRRLAGHGEGSPSIRMQHIQGFRQSALEGLEFLVQRRYFVGADSTGVLELPILQMNWVGPEERGALRCCGWGGS